MGAEHPARGGHSRSGGARPPPQEVDLGMEVLLREGYPDGGLDRDGGPPVLLQEGLRLTHGGLLLRASLLLRTRGNSPQA